MADYLHAGNFVYSNFIILKSNIVTNECDDTIVTNENQVKNYSYILFLSLASFARKDTCAVGLYVNDIYDFKIDDKSFMADFWIWINYKNDSLNFENNQEITNSKSADFTHFTKEKKIDINWAAQKCRAQVIHQWDVSNFPFDTQNLRIEIEDEERDTTQLIYTADKLNSKIDPAFSTVEWDIVNFMVIDHVRTYATNYGNPSLAGGSTYPQVVCEISIKRKHSWLLLLKMLTGAYVAFMISALVFFVSSENQDSRFGLCVGGLFAAIGNKYITESVVPSTNAFTLMDTVHNITFAYILLIVLISIFTLRLYESEKSGNKKLSLRIDRLSFWTVFISYILINVLLVAKARYNI